MNDKKLKTEIIQLISESEKRTVEFKRNFAEGKILETIVAFANAEGGKILLGVEEITEAENYDELGYQKGRITDGCNYTTTDDIKMKIVNQCASCYPKIDLLRFEFCRFKEGLVYLIEIPESIEKPIGTQKGLYLIRTDGGNIGIDPTMLRRIIIGEKVLIDALLEEMKENLPAIKFAKDCLNKEPPHISIMPLINSSLGIFIQSNKFNEFVKENKLHFLLRQIENFNFRLIIFNLRPLKDEDRINFNKIIDKIETNINRTISIIESSLMKNDV